jgi:hypothetical protein
MMLVASDREFDLGEVEANARIVREMEGKRVVGATVVKGSNLENG